jgi:hypothetical protein
VVVSFLFVDNISMHQNYFQYGNHFFQSTKGIATGSPILGIKAKTFLKESEQH